MEKKKEKFFSLLENMDKQNLYILKFVADEIASQLQRVTDGKIEISTMPDGFQCLSDLNSEPFTPTNITTRKAETEKDRKWTIDFLKNINAIKKYEYGNKGIQINANKIIFDSRYKQIKDKYDNFTVATRESKYKYFGGVLFFNGNYINRVKTKEKIKLFQELWDNREETLDGKNCRDGEKQQTSDLAIKAGYKSSDSVRKALIRFRHDISNYASIKIPGDVYKGYLITLTE